MDTSTLRYMTARVAVQRQRCTYTQKEKQISLRFIASAIHNLVLNSFQIHIRNVIKHFCTNICKFFVQQAVSFN